MKNSNGEHIVIGSCVGLTLITKQTHTSPSDRRSYKTSRVHQFMDERLYPGCVELEREVGGCLYWNIDELMLIPEGCI